MKKKILVSILLVMILCLTINLMGCKPNVALEKFDLVWADEFDNANLDTTKWSHAFQPEEGKKSQVRRGGFWSEEMVSVKDDNLVISTKYLENGDNGAGWYSGSLYTSPTLGKDGSTLNGFVQKYGYFEIRCKVPPILGAWAAFWLMPENDFKEEANKEEGAFGSADNGAEIDVFESPYYNIQSPSIKNSISHAVHYDGYDPANIKTAAKTAVKVKGLYEDYHVFGLEWSQDFYKFYVDGKLTYTLKSDSYQNAKGNKVYENIISDSNEYLFLSMEVVAGENNDTTEGWCGDPYKNDKTKSYDFVVDYVRVYQYK